MDWRKKQLFALPAMAKVGTITSLRVSVPRVKEKAP